MGQYLPRQHQTALAGTYHHVSAKHAQSYLTSFAYRFNRRFQLDSIVERLAWAAVHTAPQPYRVKWCIPFIPPIRGDWRISWV